MVMYNETSQGCPFEILDRWTSDGAAANSPLPSLFGYLCVNYVLVAICITLAVPAGIFVPSFVLGACGGRILGEILALIFPDGFRGPGIDRF